MGHYMHTDFKIILALLQYCIFGKRDKFIIDAFMSLRGRGTVDLSDYYRRDIEMQLLYFLLFDLHELPNFSESALYRIEQDVIQLKPTQLEIVSSTAGDDAPLIDLD